MDTLHVLTRRGTAGTLAAVAAALATPRLAWADIDLSTLSATDRAKVRAAAVKQSDTLRAQRKFQEALDAVMPFAGDNEFNVLVRIGQAIEGWTTPKDKLRAIEWYDKAIALKPDNKTGYVRRAGALGDVGWRMNAARLADRQKVVELSEAASPTKTAAAGEYGDLAGAHNAFVTPQGGGAVDVKRRDLVLALRSRVIALGLTFGRLLDRAEFINSRFHNPSMGRNDVDGATFLINQVDLSKPSGWYDIANYSRRVAGLPTGMSLAGAEIKVDGILTPFRPSKEQLRNQAIDYYSKYIDLFETSGRDYATYGSGIGSYENRAAVYRSLGGTSHGHAIKDQEVLIQINPRNAGYYRNLALSLDALDERTAARTYYEKYLALMEPEDTGAVAATRARLRA